MDSRKFVLHKTYPPLALEHCRTNTNMTTNQLPCCKLTVRCGQTPHQFCRCFFRKGNHGCSTSMFLYCSGSHEKENGWIETHQLSCPLPDASAKAARQWGLNSEAGQPWSCDFSSRWKSIWGFHRKTICNWWIFDDTLWWTNSLLLKMAIYSGFSH